ncbi:MAG: glycoside hydrolase family 73 protein [Ktedonobacteraceae bacterium]
MGTSKFSGAIIAAAQEAQRQTKCPASVTLAQWALESGYGKYCSAPNNYFGIKWHSKCSYPSHEVATKECYNGKWVVIQAKFIAFPSLEAACTYHGRLLMSPTGPYKSAIKFAGNWKEFLHAIAHIYATDPKYEEKIASIITSNGLDTYDVAV